MAKRKKYPPLTDPEVGTFYAAVMGILAADRKLLNGNDSEGVSPLLRQLWECGLEPSDYERLLQILHGVVDPIERHPTEPAKKKKADPLAGYPNVADCKPGLWAQLTNGWIVGPIIATAYESSVCVKFAGDVWQLDVRDDSRSRPPDVGAARLVKRVGTRSELTGRN